MCKHNRKAKGLFEGTIASGDASKDDFLLLLLLNSYTHGDEALMKEIFLMSALNRSDDRSKRKNEVAYIKYLEDSIKKATRYGNQKYWDYQEKKIVILFNTILSELSQKWCIFMKKLHDFYLPKELRTDLDYVIQTHKSENRHVQNFLDFMEWKSTKSNTPDLLYSAEFTSRYPETNEKVFSELMTNEMADEWKLEPSVKSKKVRIDGVVRVSKKFYKRNINTDFVEVNSEDIPF